MKKNDFLSSMPNFLDGMSKVLDIGSKSNTYKNIIKSEEEDLKALKSDWNAVGNDIRRSIDEFSSC